MLITMPSLPEDYLERVYAGVLGKLIGVYLGRPFEGWTHQRIVKELGHIRYYVNERLGLPLVVTDDDVAGTFTFVRALEDHDHPTSEDIGKTWLNYIIKGRTVFWWGGHGISTEHTAYLNLKKGIEAPRSGAISTNGKTIAEQIGAQIFIDGWAMAAPGNPVLAARFAQAAGSVSHDGESIYAAKMWAAMEAEAFVSQDVDHLLETGLKFVPPDSLIATLIAEVRAWCAEDGDWLKTRQRIEDKYGYDKFSGFCHVVPNHGIMIMALIYSGHDFHEAMHIVNTCGWDTDCNSGNLACLVAIMHGLAAFDGGPDWRGPIADRAFISSADGGYSINNAARIAYDIVNMGRKLVNEEPLAPPKDGAQFHFSLPGSVQGFQAAAQNRNQVTIQQNIDESCGRPGLAIRLFGLSKGSSNPVEVVSQTFAPPEVCEMESYELVSSPLVYPGQTLSAVVRAGGANTATAQVRLILRVYTFKDELETLTSKPLSLSPSESKGLEWEIPAEVIGSRPIQAVGITISNSNTEDDRLDGTVWLDSLRWTGTPTLTLMPVAEKGVPRVFYKHSFVNGASVFEVSNDCLVVAQDEDEGIVSYGTREWTDYRVVFNNFTINMGGPDRPAGVAIRVQGLNRYYALIFDSKTSNRVVLVKATGEHEKALLASRAFDWKVDTPYTVTLEAEGDHLRARVGDIELEAYDTQYQGGGIGLMATNGSILVESVEVRPLD
ncbi:ADP-ribosylation/Crystallin J1 [Hypoxylon crocopeplum]|nr:ADP-ribosylation/Crystallin J1 [Hypoxylon crocopeplum]